MVVAIDATPALRAEPSGTEVYARSMIEALAAAPSAPQLRLYANASTRPSWLPQSVEWRGIPFPRLWTHWRFRQALRRDRPDVVFIPSHVLPVGGSVPGVVTIHDLGHRQEPTAYRRTEWWYLEAMTRYMARRAAHLIAVSETTAKDLRRLYRVPAARVSVVYSGVDPRMHPPPDGGIARVRQRYGLPDTYFLYVGRDHPRKNLPLLVSAHAAARRRGLTAALVLAGSRSTGPKGDGLYVLGYVPASDLPALYGAALALTLPSRFEGFGFPVLEAMRCGTAVLASRAGALPEIIGDAGILLDPEDAASWSETMLRVARDEDLRHHLIEVGRVQSAQFSWEQAALRVLDILRRASRRH